MKNKVMYIIPIALLVFQSILTIYFFYNSRDKDYSLKLQYNDIEKLRYRYDMLKSNYYLTSQLTDLSILNLFE